MLDYLDEMRDLVPRKEWRRFVETGMSLKLELLKYRSVGVNCIDGDLGKQCTALMFTVEQAQEEYRLLHTLDNDLQGLENLTTIQECLSISDRRRNNDNPQLG